MIWGCEPAIVTYVALIGFALPVIAEEIILGIYLGLLTGIVPAFVAFGLGFIFRYFTNVTVPGLGVVALAGALAGVSGGLLGVLSPDIANSWTGISAVVVILMGALWAHSVGDALGAKTPRKWTLQRLKQTTLSADLVDRVDSFGQIRVQPMGDIHDIEGYPPLPDDVHLSIRHGSWRFPATLPLTDIEQKLEARLMDEFDLSEVSVTVDRRGRAQIAAAPAIGGLSRRIPDGTRAVTIRTLLPTGVARGDIISLRLEDDEITGPVMSARTEGVDITPAPVESPAEDGEEVPLPTLKAPTTSGGEGQVTIAVPFEAARQIIEATFAPMIVHARGKQREYEAIALLSGHGNRFRQIVVGDRAEVVGQTLREARLIDEFHVLPLTLHRGTETTVIPSQTTTIEPGDQFIVAGSRHAIRQFREAAT